MSLLSAICIQSRDAGRIPCSNRVTRSRRSIEHHQIDAFQVGGNDFTSLPLSLPTHLARILPSSLNHTQFKPASTPPSPPMSYIPHLVSPRHRDQATGATRLRVARHNYCQVSTCRITRSASTALLENRFSRTISHHSTFANLRSRHWTGKVSKGGYL